MEFEDEIKTYKVVGLYNSGHDATNFFTEEKDFLTLDLQGIRESTHHSYILKAGSRQPLYKRETEIKNNRQWSATSPQDIAIIQKNLGIEKRLTPQQLGINLLLEGEDPVSKLSPLTYLVFSQESNFQTKQEDTVVLVMYSNISPCNKAGRAIGSSLKIESIAENFKKAAKEHRGIAGWVEKGGVIKPGYNCFALTPKGIE